MELANGKKNKFFTIEEKGHNRYFIDDFDAENTEGLSNVFLLSKEVSESSIVLDIGCGQGRFGKLLKKKNCKIYGVEIDEVAAKFAMKTGFYENIFVMDITDTKSKKYKDFIETVGDVDVIILSDVLEHLEDPTCVLLSCYKILRKDGMILISVPNVAHIDISLNLLNGKFNYQDMGILDNTHLKFFTKSSFIDWIYQINNEYSNVNFNIEYLGSIIYDNSYLDEVKSKYVDLFNILQGIENYNAIQILFKLTKSKIDELNSKNEVEIQAVDIVEIIGNTLKVKNEFDDKNGISSNEKIWYENRLTSLSNLFNDIERKEKQLRIYTETIEKSIEYYKAEDKEIRQYVHELEKSIEYYKTVYKETNIENDLVKEELNNLNNEVCSLNEIVKDKSELICDLKLYINRIENSIAWKILNFFKIKY